MVYYVAYFFEAKKFEVILENWIKDFVEEKVKTYGINTSQQHLVFWSHDFNEAADFNVPKQTTFPPVGGNACFLAKIKRIFSKYFYFL